MNTEPQQNFPFPQAAWIQTVSTMRVAIAGSGGLASWIAHYLATETYHPFIILSRAVRFYPLSFKDRIVDRQQPKPHLVAKGWQVVVTNYSNGSSLAFNLAGVDTVISTISGASQLALIDAAAQAGVRRFAPSEFEGLPSLRPEQDPLDRGKRAALQRLHQYQAHGMQYCVFTCGILYERFAPGGMIASNIGRGSGVSGEGDYVLNIRQMKALIPHKPNGQPAVVCITSAQDVGRFVAMAVNLQQWPTELRMFGERMNISNLVRTAEVMRGQYLILD